MILWTHTFSSISCFIIGEGLDAVEVSILYQVVPCFKALSDPVRASGIAFCGCGYTDTKNMGSLKPNIYVANVHTFKVAGTRKQRSVQNV